MPDLKTANKEGWSFCRCTCHLENPGPKKMHMVCGCSFCPTCQMNITGSLKEHQQEAHKPEGTKHSNGAKHDFSICDCDCHKQQHMKHAIACCSKCKACGQRIKVGFEDMHKTRCPKTKVHSVGTMPTAKRIELMVEHSGH